MELKFSTLRGTVDISGQQRRCNNSPGIRIFGNRIYDSTKKIYCHQCRQKTRQIAASCKNPRDGKPCVIMFCHKCLLNRYGEKAQEVELLSDWICPKCRGICNCSCCMKKQGQQPTGALAHTAKASGFKSVSKMLEAKASKNLELNKVNDAGVLATDKATLEKELTLDLSGEIRKENSLGGNSGIKLDFLKVQKTSPEKSKKTKWEGLQEISNGNIIDDICQNKSLKRPKIFTSEVPEEETKKNANDAIKVCNKVSEKDIEENKNHNIIQEQMDGPEAWAANDFYFEPISLAPKNYFFNTYQYYVNPETHWVNYTNHP